MRTASLAVCALLASSSALAAAPLRFVDQGSAYSVQPAFVNNRGDVAFQFAPGVGGGLSRSYIVWADGDIEQVTLELPAGAQRLFGPTVWGIDESGAALIVDDVRLDDGLFRRLAYRYERGGAASLAADVERASLGNSAMGANGHFSIMRTEIPAGDSAGLVLVDPTNAQTIVGRPLDSTPIIFGMNAHGQSAGVLDAPGPGQLVTRFDADGSYETLDLTDRAFSADINDAGTVLGWRSLEPFGGYEDNADPFLWRNGAAGIEVLSRPEDALSAYASALNNLDWVGGSAIYEAPQGLPFTSERAFLWMPEVDPIDLNAYFADALNGHILMNISDISDTEWLVGQAIDSSGSVVLFIAQVPAPAAFGPLAAFGLLASRRRR
jgi:hypothetical protein